jgi:hypothetical protein
MTDQEIKQYVNKQATVTVQLRRRIGISIREILYSNAESEPNEETLYWLPGNPSIIFYATDVHNIEVSEIHGVVIRLI